jgi:hypothetical protein
VDVQSQLHALEDRVLRIGIDEGEVEAEFVDGRPTEVKGLAADQASRLMNLAEPGHVLVTERVFDDCGKVISPVQVRWQAHGLVLPKDYDCLVAVREPYNSNVVEPVPVMDESLRLRRPVRLPGDEPQTHEIESAFIWAPEFTISFWAEVTKEHLHSDGGHYLFGYNPGGLLQKNTKGEGTYPNAFALKSQSPRDQQPSLVLWGQGPDPDDHPFWHVCQYPRTQGWCFVAVTRSSRPELALTVDEAQAQVLVDFGSRWPSKPDKPRRLRIGDFPPGLGTAYFAHTRLFRFRALPRCMSYEDLMKDRDAGRRALEELGETVP